MWLLIVPILIISEVALILTHIGHFCLVNLLVLSGMVLTVVFILKRSKLRLLFSTKNMEIILFLPVLALAGILFFKPYQYMDGGWDPGGYINTGVHIGKTGSVLYHDEMLAQADDQLRKLMSGFIRKDGRGIKYPGLYIKDVRRGLVVPQFFHLYPVWIAIFYRVAGLKAVFYVNPIFALCSLALMFVLARRFIGRNHAILAGLLLAANVIQIWNARFSTSEVLGQFLLLSWFYFWISYLDSKDPFPAFFSGLAAGEFLLVSMTSLLIIPVVIIYIVFRASRRDFYFLMPFILILVHLAIQLRTFSPMYLESVTMFFSRMEFSLASGIFIAVLICVPFLKKIPERYLRSSLILIIACASIYAYFIRPRLISSNEALNLVELGKYLSLPGLLLAIGGLMTIAGREKREGVLFFVMTGLIVAFFFIYSKRMCSRYPFALRRFVPVVVPVYCFLVSYFLSFLNQKLRVRSIPVSIAAILLLTIIPGRNCKNILLARDYLGSLDFWSEFAQELDDDATYISNHYRWVRPLTDIFSKQVLAFTGTPRFAGEKVACMARELVKDGRNVFYISHLDKPYSLSVDFVEVSKKCLQTEYLEHSFTFPRELRKISLCLRVFKIVPVEESEMTAGEYTVNIGMQDMGLLSGFDEARRFSGIPEYARWTLGKTELVIPWLGDNTGQTISMFASGMPEEAGSTCASVYVGKFPIVEGYPVGEDLKEHRFFIPAGKVRTGNSKRAVLTIISNTWNPAEYGISGYPKQLGIKIYWVKIKKGALL